MLMSAADYRESLRSYKPRVFINGNAVDSVSDEPLLAPGIAGVGVTYDFALRQEHVPVMTARQHTSGKTVNRMLHINEYSQDRSEEHTSELQSLMRISYAVFCLKKKK